MKKLIKMLSLAFVVCVACITLAACGGKGLSDAEIEALKNAAREEGYSQGYQDGVRDSAATTRIDYRFDYAYRLNTNTLPLYNTMDFLIAGMVEGEYEVTFRVAVATACRDAGHMHYNAYIFNDLARVTETYTITAGNKFNGTLSTVDSGDSRGRITQELSRGDMISAGAIVASINFDLKTALAAYEGFYETAAAGNLTPATGAELVPFDFNVFGWELEIRIIVDIVKIEGETRTRVEKTIGSGASAVANPTPAMRVLWKDSNGNFWDANTIHNRGLGTRFTGGVERVFEQEVPIS